MRDSSTIQTTNIHCPVCFYVFSAYSSFKQHLLWCKHKDSESELYLENYYHPLCCNVPSHRCDVIVDGRPCLRVLDEDKCIIHSYKERDDDYEQFFLYGKLKINPYMAYNKLDDSTLERYKNYKSEKIGVFRKFKRYIGKKIRRIDNWLFT